MNYAEFLQQELGYEKKTTFWEDFSIAEKFGIAALGDTYKQVIKGWGDNVVYITELCLTLNHKIWATYKENREMGIAYDTLWRECNDYALEHFKGDELEYFYQVTD